MGGVVSAVKNIISGPPKPQIPALPPIPPVPDPAPTSNDDASIKAAEEAKKKNANRRGRSATILTGLVPDDSSANSLNNGTTVLGR